MSALEQWGEPPASASAPVEVRGRARHLLTVIGWANGRQGLCACGRVFVHDDQDVIAEMFAVHLGNVADDEPVDEQLALF